MIPITHLKSYEYKSVIPNDNGLIQKQLSSEFFIFILIKFQTYFQYKIQI